MSATVVLLHGFSGSSRSWPSVIVDGLRASDLSVAALDLPGHGRRTTVRPVDLAAAMATVDAARPSGVIGYSMGGRVALAYALEHPGRLRRLVLESASPGLAQEAERAVRRADDEAWASLLERRGLGPFLDAWETRTVFASQADLPAPVRRRVRRERERNDASALAAALRGLGTGTQPSYWDALHTLEVPTLLLVGERDATFVALAERMAEDLPAATLVVVAGAGHRVHLERPRAWLDAVVHFLG